MRIWQCCAAIFLAVSPTAAQSQDFCMMLSGTSVVAHDGQFLGRITSAFGSDSILNEFSRYGSEFSSVSIWNEFSRYGGEFSQLSAFNKFTSTPPMIIKDGRAVAYLTANEFLGGVHPFALKTCQ